VPDPDGPEASAVQARFDRVAAGIGKPWVLLSGGAAAADFERLLTYAYRAGASGYLAGRAIWAAPFRRFPDLAAMAAELAAVGPAVMDRLNAMTDRMATPWMRHAPWDDKVELAGDGPDFAPAYARFAAAG
jgi:tagatose 1,6-diphosphate aldolase